MADVRKLSSAVPGLAQTSVFQVCTEGQPSDGGLIGDAWPGVSLRDDVSQALALWIALRRLSFSFGWPAPCTSLLA